MTLKHSQIACVLFAVLSASISNGVGLPAAEGGVPPAVRPVELSGLKWTLPGTARREGNVLTFKVPEEKANKPNKAKARFHLRPYLGQELSVTVKIRGKGVRKTGGKRHWLGGKFMLMFKDEFTGEMKYPGFALPEGDFEGEYTLTVPLYGVDADYADICLGMQAACGEISFDLSTLRMSAGQELFPPKNVGYKVKYPERVLKRRPLRGAMVSPDLKEQDVADLASWGGRLMRYQFKPIREKGYDRAKATKDESIAKFRRDAAVHLGYLADNVLGWARRHGMMVVVDMHMFPSGPGASVFDDDALFEAFRDVWKTVATRLKGNSDVIYGYDIINEPGQSKPAKYGYFGLQERIARDIRAIDPETTIVMESASACAPDAYSYMNALDMDNVIYQVHVYQPLVYTHQGVGAGRGAPSAYPRPAKGNIGAVDKEYLRKVIEPVRRFQREHGCRIYVGEFSVAAWAEGGARYLEDLISLFEEYGWDWTYHAFREATVWSVEHEATDSSHRRKAETDTDRKKVLLKGFSKGL